MAVHLRSDIAKALHKLLASPLSPGDFSLAKDWKTFYRLQKGRLFRVGREVGLRPGRIEEVLETVWVAMLRHWETLKLRGARVVLNWTRKRMRSRAVDAMRRDDRRRADSLEALAEEPPARGPSQEAVRVRGEELLAWVEARLKELPEKDQANVALLRMRYQERLPLADIAARTGLPIAAIKGRLTRLLRKLRRLARKHPPGGEPLA